MSTFDNIGIIGAGNMGSAIANGLITNPKFDSKLYIADHNQNNLDKFQASDTLITTNNCSIILDNSDVIILAVKPQSMRELIAGFKISTVKQPILVSVAAGITCQQISNWLQAPHIKVMRAMPNTPALFGKGITTIFSNKAESGIQDKVANIFAAVGKTAFIEQEQYMDLVTAVAGSGPAYFFYIIEHMIKTATDAGLSKQLATTLVTETAFGSAYMAINSPDSITTLRKKVTSPGGTTEQGINCLQDAKLGELITAAITAATKRGQELSQMYD